MNHFMLPKASTGNTQGASYGVNSMKLLIDGCISHGAQKCDLEAKVFGGGHVLRMRETEDSVPRINIRFTLDYLQNEGIPIVAHDVGGYAAREVYFFTDSGRALIKRMNKTGLRLEDHSIIQNDELLLEFLTTDPAPLLDAHGYRLL
jgi:chemotaxis protein CheD